MVRRHAAQLTHHTLTFSSSSQAEIIMHEGVTAVYKSNVDLFFYVLGSQNENEVSSALFQLFVFNPLHTVAHVDGGAQCGVWFREPDIEVNDVTLRVCIAFHVYNIHRKNVEKRSLFEHMDALLLVLDEVVDGG